MSFLRYQRQVERVREAQRRRAEQRGESLPEGNVDPTEDLRPSISESLEKGDRFSLFLSAFLTIFLPSVLVLLALAALVFLLFGLW